MDFGGLVKLFVDYPGAVVAMGEAVVGGIVIKTLFSRLMDAHAANLDTALRIAPVAEKLAEGVEALERLLERRGRNE